jgi:hypothetical protein
MINENAPKLDFEKPKKEEKKNKFKRNWELQNDLNTFNFMVNSVTLEYLKKQSEFSSEEYSQIFEEIGGIESKIVQQMRELDNE